MSAWTIAATVLGLYVGLLLVGFVITLHRLLRMRLSPACVRPLRDEELAPPIAALFQRAQNELGRLGFEPQSLIGQHGPLVGAAPTPVLLLRHDERRVWAIVSPSQAPTPGALLRLALVSYWEPEGSLTTLSGESWALSARAPEHRVIDRYRLSWSEQVRDHLEALTKEPARRVRELDLSSFLQELERSFADALSDAVPLADDGATRRYGIPWWSACKLAARMLVPPSAQRQLLAQRARLAPWEPEVTVALPWVEAFNFRQHQALLAMPARAGMAWVVFLVSAALFAASMLLFGSLRMVAALSLVLLIHELGHWLAMRAFGFGQSAIFFIPFFGAATSGEKRDASLAQRLVVLAAGPVPGLIAGLAILAFTRAPSADLRELASLAVAVNAANLLPILPLDGGRIVQHLITKQHPWLETSAALISVAAFALLAVLAAQPLLFAIAAIALLATRYNFEAARTARQLPVVANTNDGDLTIEIFQALQTRKLGPLTKVTVARSVLARLAEPPSSLRARVFGWGGYLAILALAIAGLTKLPRTRSSVEIACSEFTGKERTAPASMPKEALRVGCKPMPYSTLEPMRAELDILAQLPTALCLRQPWLPAEPVEAAREARARRTVVALAQEVKAQREHVYSGAESAATMRRILRAERGAALAAVERTIAERTGHADFDLPAASAYASYLRETADIEASDEARVEAAAAAVSALLGTRASCPAPFGVLSVALTKKRGLDVWMFGDPAELAGYFCRSGCEVVSVRAAEPDVESPDTNAP